MRPLRCLGALLTALAITAPGIAGADDGTTEPRFSTVKLFFVNQYLPDPAAKPGPPGSTHYGSMGSAGLPIEKGMKADELERRKRIEDRLRKGPLDDVDSEPKPARPPRKE